MSTVICTENEDFMRGKGQKKRFFRKGEKCLKNGEICRKIYYENMSKRKEKVKAYGRKQIDLGRPSGVGAHMP